MIKAANLYFVLIGLCFLVFIFVPESRPEPVLGRMTIEMNGTLTLLDKDGCIFVISGQTGRFTLCHDITPKQPYETEERIARALRDIGLHHG